MKFDHFLQSLNKCSPGSGSMVIKVNKLHKSDQFSTLVFISFMAC